MGTSTILDSEPATPPRAARQRDRLAAQTLATDVARLHGDALLRTARRFADDPDDAHDAYQRALELLLEHAATIERAKVVAWMHVVVRREASALRRRHDRHIPFDVDTVDEFQRSDRTDEHLDRIDLAQRAGEALATLKENEAQALCLRAQGLSYEEIADAYGWSYTKVNRAVSEGRRAFVDHYLGAERGDLCALAGDRLGAFLAGELRAREHLRIKAHLTRCSGCRAQLHAERGADQALRALLPPTVAGVTQTAWLHDHLLGPIGDLAGRLAPHADQALGAKVGVAAVSVAAIAGGGVTVERHLATHEPPRAIRAALTTDPPARTESAPAAVTAAVAAAATSGERIAETARERQAAAQRRAAARKKAAAARRAKTAAAREFAPATREFSGSRTATQTATRSGGASSTSGGASDTTGAVPSAPVEVPVDAAASDPGITVTDDAGTP
ncbi:MAG: sigma-70 family RNA polymerase sigma factor [Solirubrobacteraceae bacterium]|nr:sigma-70 family RNA polymerase sigma factor [Solirubrobacteraceae bacterium]